VKQNLGPSPTTELNGELREMKDSRNINKTGVVTAVVERSLLMWCHELKQRKTATSPKNGKTMSSNYSTSSGTLNSEGRKRNGGKASHSATGKGTAAHAQSGRMQKQRPTLHASPEKRDTKWGKTRSGQASMVTTARNFSRGRSYSTC